MQLLRDYYPLSNLQIISENKVTGKMKLRGTFQRADEANQNNRIYPKSILEREVKKLQDLIKENRLVGELDHPNYDVVKLSNASHKITDLRMEGNEVIGELELLSTPAGQVAQALVRDGVELGISSRALGSLKESEAFPGKKEVNEDLNVKTWDLVTDPSVEGAFVGLTESVENQKKIESAYKKVLGEKVFLTMLKEALKDYMDEDDSGLNLLESVDLNKVRKRVAAAKVRRGQTKKGKEKSERNFKVMNNPEADRDSREKALQKRVKDLRRRGKIQGDPSGQKFNEGSAGIKNSRRKARGTHKKLEKANAAVRKTVPGSKEEDDAVNHQNKTRSDLTQKQSRLVRKLYKEGSAGLQRTGRVAKAMVKKFKGNTEVKPETYDAIDKHDRAIDSAKKRFNKKNPGLLDKLKQRNKKKD